MYAALEMSDAVPEEVLQMIAVDPVEYASAVPEPGEGSGIYSWVNELEREES